MKDSIDMIKNRAAYIFKSIGFILPLFFFLVSASQVFAQQRDYAKYPENPFQYHHLDLKMELEVNQGVIKGEAEYTLAPYLKDTRQIILQANRIDIHSVWVNGKQITFDLHSDSLMINLPKAFPAGQNFKLKIIYEAQPIFGLNHDAQGTYWTSMLPMTSSHIFPVLDNPRVAVTTNVHLVVPIDYTTVSNGVLVSSKTVRKGWKEDNWRSDVAIPVTDIGFAAGKLTYSEAMMGVIKIRIYNEKGLLTSDQRSALLNEAYQKLQQVQHFLTMGYPYSSLNIVVLNDDRWEKKSSGASYAYAFVNRGDLKNQVNKDIYSQWFGAYQRSGEYADASGELLLQAWLQWSLNHTVQTGWTIPDTLGNRPSFYNSYSVSNWERWQQFFRMNKDTLLTTIIDKTFPELLQQKKGVMDWNDYARFWYDHSGRWFDQPVAPKLKKPKKLEYQFNYTYNAVKGQLNIVIDTLKGHSDELISLPLAESRTGLSKKMITFSGIGDTLHLKTKPGLMDVNVDIPDSLNIKVVQKKPVSFWFYQLRSGDTPQLRAAAAIGLGDHTGDPDLQLALVDRLNKEENHVVQAAIITALGKITQGATGTDQLFLNAMNNPSPKVKLAIVKALANYPGDSSAISAIQSLIHRTDDPQIIRAGLWTLRAIDSSNYQNFAQAFEASDSSHVYTSTILKSLVQNGDTTLVAKMASYSMGSDYPYNVRVVSLNLLRKYAPGEEAWKHRLAMLVQDNDPRIRYIAWGLAAQILNKADLRKLINVQMPDEDDIRVLHRIQAINREQ